MTASAQVSIKVTADNSYAVYAGDGTAANGLGFVGTATATLASQIGNAGSFNVDVGSCGYVYVVAWSDASTAQGLLASVSAGTNTILTGDPRWQVFATNTNLGTNGAPSSAPFITALKAKIAAATWTAPAVGVANTTTNGVEPYAAAIPATAKWIWYQSGKPACAGAKSPFKPGCNHNEYLIFRLPAKDLLPPPAFTSLNPDFQLTATIPIGNTTTFQVAATNPPLPPGSKFFWSVEEVDNSGATIGTPLVNPPAWWSNPTTNNFSGFTFQQNHRYKITRGMWSSCVPWTAITKTVYARTN
jgi:hypothetical protein